MSARYSGRCACGAVTLKISGDAIGTRQCWCKRCQQIAGGGPTHNAIFKTEDVSVMGELTSSGWVADSGNTLTFSFCPKCGTQVYGQSSARMHLKTVRLGMLDQRDELGPQMAIWLDDAPKWACIDPALEHWPRQPPAPPPPPEN